MVAIHTLLRPPRKLDRPSNDELRFSADAGDKGAAEELEKRKRKYSAFADRYNTGA